MIKAISKLKSLGAISECNTTKDQFISKIFLTRKPNGDNRFILNLKEYHPLHKNLTLGVARLSGRRSVDGAPAHTPLH
ncbi:unnamed protein product [Parnassius mnemosyne]|uniref:Uncharacterized protein n=1 Tax=Parnassius mnemosyne TaxID=213953 RepID=A0AAV1L3D8_9NEOP